MNDRGIIKWMPFNSVISSAIILEEIKKKKNKVNLPLLSEEQKLYLERQIIEAFHTQNNITVTYYYNGYINQISTKIKALNYLKKEIIFHNSLKLSFYQIINID